MARQCGINVFVGTRYGCTGYVMHGLPYMRRRSSLDEGQWKKSAAFVRSREASVVFGGASSFASQVWRGIPRKMKGLMDAGAYNRLVVAVQQTHLANGASYEFRQGRGKVQAHYAKVVERFEGKHLGKALNGMDLSSLSLSSGPEFVGIGARNGTKGDKACSLGDFFYLEGVDCVRVDGLAQLARFVPDGAAVRVRLHVARVEALPHRWDAFAKRYLSEGKLQGERAYTASPWKTVASRGEGSDSVSVAFPGRIIVGGDEERWFLNFVALEVGIRIGDGRWRRLDSACKSYVVCNMQGGDVPMPTPSASETGAGMPMPSASETGAGLGCGVADSGVVPMPTHMPTPTPLASEASAGIGCRVMPLPTSLASEVDVGAFGDGVFELDVGDERHSR